MDLEVLYYIILGITVVSYLLGLFLSHFEKNCSISSFGNAGFINIFGASSSKVVSAQGNSPVKKSVSCSHFCSRMDEEII